MHIHGTALDYVRSKLDPYKVIDFDKEYLGTSFGDDESQEAAFRRYRAAASAQTVALAVAPEKSVRTVARGVIRAGGEVTAADFEGFYYPDGHGRSAREVIEFLVARMYLCRR